MTAPSTVRKVPLWTVVRFWLSVCLLLWCLQSPGVSAAEGHRGSTEVDATQFGSSVRLAGPWVSSSGSDDARDASGARADLDDRRWVVLAPEQPLSKQGLGGAHNLWYRLHLRLRPDAPATAVFVKGLAKSYRVYANGELIGGQGEMNATDPDREHPMAAFAIPPAVLQRAQGKVVLAIRVNGGATGFYNVPPMETGTSVELVHPSQVVYRESYGLAHDWGMAWVTVGLGLSVGLCGLVIWSSLKDQTEYLALAVWLLSSALSGIVYFRAHLGAAAPTSGLTLLNLVLRGASLVGELEFMRILLRLRRSVRWLSLEVLCVSMGFVVVLVNTGKLPLTLGAVTYFSQLAITELFVGLILLRGVVRGNREARLLLLPVLLWSFTDFYRLVNFVLWGAFRIKVPDLPEFHLFSYPIRFASLADVLGLLSLMLIILRRTVRLSREKADLAAELAAAEELQVLLLSRASRPTPGYRVDTVYRPMQQVGGDFFLVQPCEEDDSLVAVVGDVSGKGLQAAMRVSMILGVLQREVMGQPDRVLAKLNAALLDQGDFGFTTACCVRLERDGTFSFANAGHLNPYVDGTELESDGALPLGMDPQASYPVQRGRLLDGQCMVLLSDGVLEARSRKGELLGFERMRELVRQGAVSIAEAAQRFGQEDDITVLALALAQR